MDVSVAQSIARSISHINQMTQILWHGGEPLTAGVSRLTKLVEAFESLREQRRVRHSLQTNGTVISDKWCKFLKHYGFTVGVSIDGNAKQNRRRVDWRGRSSFNAAMRGIETLRKNGIPFRIIAVVSVANVDDPGEFYEFFKNLGCESLAINIEEQEGFYREGDLVTTKKVEVFWRNLYEVWLKDPVLNILEIDRALSWIQSYPEDETAVRTTRSNLWPTVAINGDVVVMAPELMSAGPEELHKLTVGNVISTSLPQIVQSARRAWYVQEFRKGIHMCAEECPYFSYCGGGHASNKFFEKGRFDVTDTNHCRNHEIAVINGVLAGVESL